MEEKKISSELTGSPKTYSLLERGPEGARAVRTMKSDIAELTRKKEASLEAVAAQLSSSLSPAGGETPTLQKKTPFALLLILWLLVLFGIGAGGFYYFLILQKKGDPAPIVKEEKTPVFFATETSETIDVTQDNKNNIPRIIEGTVHASDRAGVFKRIVVRMTDGPVTRFATLQDIFDIEGINAFSGFTEFTPYPVALFIRYGDTGNQFGIVTEIKESERERIFATLLAWERSLPFDMRPLYFGEAIATTTVVFQDHTYHNIDWRFADLSSQKDFGIGYMTFPAKNYIVITTGKKMMEETIDRLFGTR